ncbi:hypothetical protein DQP58_00795 [Mycobacterium colombiense]|uniref:Uncharacterized protein n=1 Tax=Mycobacterium colombiense TaxID=339268 RepID=A0A329KZH4_9MYCO|nr:hypothetical protein DQP58_00795 [Mycobacterium colombiense]
MARTGVPAGKLARPRQFLADGFRAHRLVYGASFLALRTISGDVRNPRDDPKALSKLRECAERPPDLA